LFLFGYEKGVESEYGVKGGGERKYFMGQRDAVRDRNLGQLRKLYRGKAHSYSRIIGRRDVAYRSLVAASLISENGSVLPLKILLRPE
jgi:hypothetical protein